MVISRLGVTSFLTPRASLLRSASYSASSNSGKRKASVCIVGSGPAGFYTAQSLLRKVKKDASIDLSIDILERLPVPYGLVRYGVAPDHPDVKNVESTFEKIADDERVRFVGNVNIGNDVKVSELRTMFDVVVLAYGAAQDRKLHIPGEDDSPDVMSARAFVGFYNGLPDHSNLHIDLSKHRNVTIVGVGNVSIDIARVLLSPIDLLAKTDMTSDSLDVLSQSAVETVTIVGRRGPLDVAFTIKEFRELLNMTSVSQRYNPPVFDGDFMSISEEFISTKLDRRRRRLSQLLWNASHQKHEFPASRLDHSRQWYLKLFRTPHAINVDGETESVNGLQVKHSRYEFDSGSQQFKTVPTGEMSTIDCSLVMRSVGYRSVQVESGLPFDDRLGIIPNDNGRVAGEEGLFCSGWLATGPRGVIVDTMASAHSVGHNIWQYISSLDMKSDIERGGRDQLTSCLRERGIPTVDKIDWHRIDEIERQQGAKRGKPREKMTNFQAFLSTKKHDGEQDRSTDP